MTRTTAVPARRPHAGAGPAGRRVRDEQDGVLTLEWALTLPVTVALVTVLLTAGLLLRDVLVLQEAARVGARTAATTSADGEVRAATRAAAPELERVVVEIVRGERHVEVVASTTSGHGPLRRDLTTRSVAAQEPIVGATTPPPDAGAHPPSRAGP